MKYNLKLSWKVIAISVLILGVCALIASVFYPSVRETLTSPLFWRDMAICGMLTLWGWAVPPVCRWPAKQQHLVSGFWIGLATIVLTLCSGCVDFLPDKGTTLAEIATTLVFILGLFLLISSWSHLLMLAATEIQKELHEHHLLPNHLYREDMPEGWPNIGSIAPIMCLVMILIAALAIATDNTSISWAKYVASVVIGCIISLIRGK